MMNITEKQANVLSMLIMVAVMTCIVTLVMALINGNLQLFKWLKGWGLSFLVAFPVVLIIMPITKKLVFKLFKIK
ncbi:MAG: DUF2798 domain-containing protein [Bacteroidales bacterium]